MNIWELPFALIAFLGFVAVAPPWMWFVSQYPSLSSMPGHTRFLVGLILPALAALYIASWLEPGGTQP